jgi:hypothetical protein
MQMVVLVILEFQQLIILHHPPTLYCVLYSTMELVHYIDDDVRN